MWVGTNGLCLYEAEHLAHSCVLLCLCMWLPLSHPSPHQRRRKRGKQGKPGAAHVVPSTSNASVTAGTSLLASSPGAALAPGVGLLSRQQPGVSPPPTTRKRSRGGAGPAAAPYTTAETGPAAPSGKGGKKHRGSPSTGVAAAGGDAAAAAAMTPTGTAAAAAGGGGAGMGAGKRKRRGNSSIGGVALAIVCPEPLAGGGMRSTRQKAGRGTAMPLPHVVQAATDAARVIEGLGHQMSQPTTWEGRQGQGAAGRAAAAAVAPAHLVPSAAAAGARSEQQQELPPHGSLPTTPLPCPGRSELAEANVAAAGGGSAPVTAAAAAAAAGGGLADAAAGGGSSAATAAGGSAGADQAIDGSPVLATVVGNSSSSISGSIHCPWWLKRCMALMNTGKWMDALDLLTAQQEEVENPDLEPAAATVQLPAAAAAAATVQLPAAAAAAGGRGGGGEGRAAGVSGGGHHTTKDLWQACKAICCAKLGLPEPLGGRFHFKGSEAIGSIATPAAIAGALQHVASALAAPGAITSRRASSAAPSAAEAREADAAAVGHAIAYLLHPATAASADDGIATTATVPRLPSKLSEEAWQVVSSKGKGVLTAGPLLATAAGSGSGGGGVSRQKAAERQERSKGSKALTELLQMVGLEPVKQQMFNLADQVRGGGRRGRGGRAELTM